MIRIKPGVDLSNLQPQMLLAILVVASVYREDLKSDCTITSGRDGDHRHVLHYVGQALDFRTRDLIPSDLERLEGLVQEALGGEESQYDVVLEANHLHVEFDPRPDRVPRPV